MMDDDTHRRRRQNAIMGGFDGHGPAFARICCKVIWRDL
jgi:hypothetical protein